MKRTLKYIAALSMTVLLSSCGNDWLNTNSDDSFPSDEPLTTKNLESMRVGMYNALQNSSTYYGARMIYDGDIRGDDFQYKNEGASRGSSSYAYTYNTTGTEGCWGDAYYLIKTANSIIQAAPELTDAKANKVKIDDIVGQAYMMRALGHFDVLRNYGEFYDVNSKWGIPIMDRVIPNEELMTNKPSRSTVAKVYAKILEDLAGSPDQKGAIELMAKKKATAGFATVWAAKALLCRVYLYMGENQKCLDLANDIISNSPYALWKNNEYVNAWSQMGNSENLFEILNNTEDNNGREGIGYLMFPSSQDKGYAAVVATLQYANLFQEGDVRKELFFADTKAVSSKPWAKKKIFMAKYPGVEKDSKGEEWDNMTASIPVFRLSEVYLNGAEAAQKLGDAQVNSLLTTIVQRANPAAPAVTGANLERVLLERRLELGGEGFRFYDALRNNKAMHRDNVLKYMIEVDASGVQISVPAGLEAENEALHPVLNSAYLTIDRNSQKIIYPIPSREINVINSDNEIIEQYYKW